MIMISKGFEWRTLCLGYISLLIIMISGCGVPLAPPEVDLAAKQLGPDGDTALIYVYRTWAFGNDTPFDIDINGENIGKIDCKTFLYFRSSPGTLTVRANGYIKTKITVTRRNVYYVKLEDHAYTTSFLYEVPQSQGQADIATMKLVALDRIALIKTRDSDKPVTKEQQAAQAKVDRCLKQCSNQSNQCYVRCGGNAMGAILGTPGGNSTAVVRQIGCQSECDTESNACNQTCEGQGTEQSAATAGSEIVSDQINRTGSNLQYNGLYSTEVRRLLSRSPRPWKTPSCLQCQDGIAPGTPPDLPCQRDAYVYAALNYAWAVESYTRNNDPNKAQETAQGVKDNLNKANALCSSASANKPGVICSTQQLWPCPGW